jgi:2,4-dienoyl-CoA reductase-like NADH-dependent reductase (Old Yellow Enzyme family)
MFQKLFEPIQIGKITIKNRVAMAPMVTAYSDRGGYISEQQMAYYAARARGGVGLIITEHILASKWAEDNCPLNVMGLYDISHMLGLADLVDTIHTFGARTFIQMNPGLGVQGSALSRGVQPVGPSTIGYKTKPETVAKNVDFSLYMVGETPREMSVEEIEREQNNFASAAMMAQMVGFDGLEIHAAHGFLLHDFMSPRFNLRTDHYGGSLENRLRFLLELVRKTRAAVGSEMVIGVRASAHEPDGTTYEDMKSVVYLLEKEGVDYFHFGDGTFEALNWLLPDKDGTMLEMEKAMGFKEQLRMPVITPSIHDPEMAERAVREGMTDMVSLGRALLADPEWVNKVESGRLKEIRKCTRCNIGCFARLFKGLRVQCVLNPENGLEKYNPAYTRWSMIRK